MDLLSAGSWNSGSEDVPRDGARPSPLLLRLKGNAFALPMNRITQRTTRNTEATHVCGDVQGEDCILSILDRWIAELTQQDLKRAMILPGVQRTQERITRTVAGSNSGSS